MVALYISLCFATAHGPAVCREVPLTPGAAGPAYATMEACQHDQWQAIQRWFAEAGPVFGISDFRGPGYEIKAMRCGEQMPVRWEE